MKNQSSEDSKTADLVSEIRKKLIDVRAGLDAAQSGDLAEGNPFNPTAARVSLGQNSLSDVLRLLGGLGDYLAIPRDELADLAGLPGFEGLQPGERVLEPAAYRALDRAADHFHNVERAVAEGLEVTAQAWSSAGTKLRFAACQAIRASFVPRDTPEAAEFLDRHIRDVNARVEAAAAGADQLADEGFERAADRELRDRLAGAPNDKSAPPAPEDAPRFSPTSFPEAVGRAILEKRTDASTHQILRDCVDAFRREEEAHCAQEREDYSTDLKQWACNVATAAEALLAELAIEDVHKDRLADAIIAWRELVDSLAMKGYWVQDGASDLKRLRFTGEKMAEAAAAKLGALRFGSSTRPEFDPITEPAPSAELTVEERRDPDLKRIAAAVEELAADAAKLRRHFPEILGSLRKAADGLGAPPADPLIPAPPLARIASAAERAVSSDAPKVNATAAELRELAQAGKSDLLGATRSKRVGDILGALADELEKA